MSKHFIVVATLSLAIIFVSAKPLPQWDISDSEPVAPADTFHNGYAFWLGRPYYEMDDDAGDNGSFDSSVKKGTPTMSYASIGGGWGR
ncbi:uncharacterized protein LOC143260155 [Megalopta genalis]|uniref:uncharacterized protein LOC143260155 n=1 Tax=Megalopta genalis TaxID=115081 RepID=UPI003FCEECF8